MKVNLNLSLDIETAKHVEEMKEKGIKPSHFFCALVKEFAKNGYKYPVNYEPESAI